MNFKMEKAHLHQPNMNLLPFSFLLNVNYLLLPGNILAFKNVISNISVNKTAKNVTNVLIKVRERSKIIDTNSKDCKQ